MVKIAFSGSKGGTGKTTVAANSAVSLAVQGYNVVYIERDLEDPNGLDVFQSNIINRTLMHEPLEEYIPIHKKIKDIESVLIQNIKDAKKDDVGGHELLLAMEKLAHSTGDTREPQQLVESLLNIENKGSYRNIDSFVEGDDVLKILKRLDSDDARQVVRNRLSDILDNKVNLKGLLNTTNIENLGVVVAEDDQNLANLQKNYPLFAEKLNQFYDNIAEKDNITVDDCGAGSEDHKVNTFLNADYKVLVVNHDDASMDAALKILEYSINNAIKEEFSAEDGLDKKVMDVFNAEGTSHADFFEYFTKAPENSERLSEIQRKIGEYGLKDDDESKAKVEELRAEYQSLNKSEFSDEQRLQINDRIKKAMGRFNEVYVVMNRVGSGCVDAREIKNKVEKAMGYLADMITRAHYDLGVDINYFGEDGIVKFQTPEHKSNSEIKEMRNTLSRVIKGDRGEDIPISVFDDYIGEIARQTYFDENRIIREVSGIQTINGDGFFTVFKNPKSGDYHLVGGEEDRKKYSKDDEINGGKTLNMLTQHIVEKERAKQGEKR